MFYLCINNELKGLSDIYKFFSGDIVFLTFIPFY